MGSDEDSRPPGDEEDRDDNGNAMLIAGAIAVLALIGGVALLATGLIKIALI